MSKVNSRSSFFLLAENYQLRFYRKPARPSSARPAPPRLKKAESIEEPQPRFVFISLNSLNLYSEKELLIMVQSIQEQNEFCVLEPTEGYLPQFFLGLFLNTLTHMCRSMVKNEGKKTKVKMNHRKGEKQVI